MAKKFTKYPVTCSDEARRPMFFVQGTSDGDRYINKFYSEQELVDSFRERVDWMNPEECNYWDLDPSIFEINTLDDVITYINNGPYDTGWGYIPGDYQTLYDANMDELAYGEI